MTDRQTTASAIISFSERLEVGASSFYRALSERFREHEDTFLGFAEDSEKNKVLLTRTYRETISDALEAGFAFQGLELEDYVVEVTLGEGIGLAEALERAHEMEDKAISFYLKVAEQSRSLLATIPTAFRRVARRREGRSKVLRSLSDESVTNS
jgi:rubrerythrin